MQSHSRTSSVMNEHMAGLNFRDDKSSNGGMIEFDINATESILQLPGMSNEVRESWQN